MKKEIVKHDPENSVIDAIWIWLSTNPPDDYDPGVHSEDFHNIPSGSHSPVIGAYEMAQDIANGERIARRQKSATLSTPLMILGALALLYVAVMFGVTRFEYTSAYFWFALKTLGVGLVGTYIFFSGMARMG